MSDRRPGDRETHSLRFRNDTWGTIEDLAGPGKTNQLIELAAEVMCGYVRCVRCRRAVLVELGNCTGMTFLEAALAAQDAVRQQKCGSHKPVKVKTKSSAATVDGDTAAELAGLRAAVEQIQERLAPSVTPSPIPFRPPAVTR